MVKLSSKGQIVIPKSIRKALGLNTGSLLQLDLDEDKIVIRPINEKTIRSYAGILNEPDLMQDYLEEKRNSIKNERK